MTGYVHNVPDTSPLLVRIVETVALQNVMPKVQIQLVLLAVGERAEESSEHLAKRAVRPKATQRRQLREKRA